MLKLVDLLERKDDLDRRKRVTANEEGTNTLNRFFLTSESGSARLQSQPPTKEASNPDVLAAGVHCTAFLASASSKAFTVIHRQSALRFSFRGPFFSNVDVRPAQGDPASFRTCPSRTRSYFERVEHTSFSIPGTPPPLFLSSKLFPLVPTLRFHTFSPFPI